MDWIDWGKLLKRLDCFRGEKFFGVPLAELIPELVGIEEWRQGIARATADVIPGVFNHQPFDELDRFGEHWNGLRGARDCTSAMICSSADSL